MPKKLLVADDSITIQKVVCLTFAGEDVVIESVANGDLAIERVKEFRPDIVLADIFMPGRNGYEVCAAIKEDPEFSMIPVVLLIGTFEPFDEAEAARVKCDAYLTKPFDTSELLQIVHSLVGGEPPIPDESEKAGDLAEEVRVQGNAVGQIPETPQPLPPLRLVSDRTRESFLGADRVLDIFGPDNKTPIYMPALVQPVQAMGTVSQTVAAATVAVKSELPPPAGELSEDTLNAIVERVVQRISQDVVREIAWEVVPEMSEIIIRQCLAEKGKI